MTVALGRDEPLVGRETELKALLDVFARGKPAFVLLIGEPRMGKDRVLREVRARIARYPYVVIPEASPSDDRPWLTIDKRTTPETFSAAIPPSRSDTGPSLEEPGSERKRHWLVDLTVILVYGYQPDKRFDAWFTQEFLPELRTSNSPRIVLLAGYPSDVRHLERLADERVLLGPLPRAAVEADLRAFNDEITDKMDDRELQMYADGVAKDPSLLVALRTLLRRYSSSPP
jgi:hypothetical protein